MTNWSRSRIIFLYIASLLPGLSVLAELFGIYARDLWQSELTNSQIFSWAVLPPRPKIQHMVEYAALTLMGGLLLAAVFISDRRSTNEVSLKRVESRALWVYLLLCFVLPPFLSGPAFGLLWLSLASALPALVGTRRFLIRQGTRDTSTGIYAAYPLVCGVALGGLLVLLYATAWNPTLRFGNDYAGLPEYTRMSDGRWVENNSFLQENRVLGRVELDPCDGSFTGGLCLDMPRKAFRSAREAFVFFPSGSGLHYSWHEEKLRAYRTPTAQECLLIDALLQSPQTVCRQLGGKSHKAMQPSNYSILVAEFRQKNLNSLGAQELLGRFFFHHAYLYLPVLQTIAGVASDSAALPAQYGVGLTASFAKLLQWRGSHAFQDYFQLYWVGPGLYVVLAALVVLALTRRASLAVATAALVIGLLPFQSIDGLRLAPGFNPWRHLPDLLCFLAIGLHALRPSVVTALLRASSIALLLWWNREFGMFMLAGSTTWHLLTVMQAPARLLTVAGSVLAEFLGCGLVVVSLVGLTGTNELAFYNLLGVGAPITRWHEVTLFSAVWLLSIGFVAWARFRPAQKLPLPELEVAGVGLCYAAFSSIYGLWNPSPGNLSVVLLCAALPIMCLTNWGFETAGGSLGISQRWMHAYLSISLSTVTLVTSLAVALNTESVFEKMFHDHRVFQWALPGINGRTTADPTPIEQALDLLQKEQSEGGVVLISRYDILLHTASGRLSKLPYIDLPSAVISWPVIDSILGHIDAAKPQVIFMDHDIFANREWQLLAEADRFERSNFYYNAFSTPGINSFMLNKGLLELSPLELAVEDLPRSVPPNYHRVGHLAALSMLAREVSKCYEPGPISGVLQAWYRRCKE